MGDIWVRMPDVTLSPAERRIEFELFDRYVNGTATPADQAHVEQWAAFDPAHVDLLTIARTGRRAVALDAAIDVESALARTHAAIDASARAHRTMPSTVPTGWWRHAMGTAAAGVIAVLAWSPVTRWMTETRASASVPQVVTTARAERTTLTLPDGSSVILGPASTLRYRGGRTAGSRTVELQGQAYFTVSHAAERPFVIQAGGVTARVLGTTFSVRAYPTDGITQVAVAEGKVAVGDGSAQAILLAGDVAHARAGDVPRVTHDARVADVFGWTRGRLTFTDVPLRDVVRELERTYDLTITCADSVLARRLVTITIPNHAAGDALRALAFVVDASIEQQGRDVVLRRRTR